MTVLEAWVADDFDFTEVAAAALDPELHACAAVVLAFASAVDVRREAGVLEAEALEPEPPAVVECVRAQGEEPHADEQRERHQHDLERTGNLGHL